MIDFNIGVSIVSTYEVKKIDNDYFGVEQKSGKSILRNNLRYQESATNTTSSNTKYVFFTLFLQLVLFGNVAAGQDNPGTWVTETRELPGKGDICQRNLF